MHYYLSPVIAIIRNAGRFLKLNQTTPLLTPPYANARKQAERGSLRGAGAVH